MDMGKTTVLGMVCLAAAMVACAGNTTKGGGETDSDSVVAMTDSMRVPDGGFEAIERMAGLPTPVPPVPLYVRTDPDEGQVVEVVYWTPLVKPSADDAPEYQESWRIQERMRQQKNQYTKVMGEDGQLCDVTFVEDVTSEEADNAMLRSPQSPMQGLKFKFNNSKDLKNLQGDGYCYRLLWLLADEYVNPRMQLTVKTVPTAQRKPLPAEVVKAMEAKYGMKADRSALTATIGNDYKTGFIQFKPKGKQCLAVELLMCGDDIWSYSDEAQYFEGEGFTWHVDDDGEYYPNIYDVAFVGPDGIELLFTHLSAESTGFGWMTIKGDKLVQHEVGGYYNYPE